MATAKEVSICDNLRMTTSTNDAHQVLRQFRIIFNAVKGHFQQIEKAVGIGGAQVWALSVVAQCPGIKMGDLAKAMDIHQSTASNMVKAMVAQNLLQVQRDETDKRATHLTLTKAGAKLLERAPTPLAGVLPEALERLQPEVLHRLAIDLQHLITLLDCEKHPDAAHTPLADM